MATLLALPLFFCLLAPRTFSTAVGRANKTKCSGNLRNLGFAAMQYADDKRFYPHVNAYRELDGGYDSNHTPKVVRTLSYYGYHDNPEGWICPESYDMSTPVSARSYEQPRVWFWGGGLLEDPEPAVSPLYDGLPDPSLRGTDELSYGWSRKGLPVGARSTVVLAADRALRGEPDREYELPPGEIGCHFDGVNVLTVDGSVQYMPREDLLAQGDQRRALDALNLYHASFDRPPAPVPLRVPGWMQTTAPVAGWALLLGWLGHLGWRRRTPLAPKARRKRWFTVDVIGVGRGALGVPQPRVALVVRPEVTLSPGQRCPYCHEGIHGLADLVACHLCATLLHRDCAQEGGACSTFGCKNGRAGRG